MGTHMSTRFKQIKNMKLTKKDKEHLYKLGHSLEEVKQIEHCIRHTSYLNEECKKISRKVAIERIGRECWLNGISRSAFHWTSTQVNNDTNEIVYFDSSAFFIN